jgi:hypothetical protein
MTAKARVALRDGHRNPFEEEDGGFESHERYRKILFPSGLWQTYIRTCLKLHCVLLLIQFLQLCDCFRHKDCMYEYYDSLLVSYIVPKSDNCFILTLIKCEVVNYFFKRKNVCFYCAGGGTLKCTKENI